MSTPQSRLDMDRVLKTIDAPAAVVILVAEDGTLETAAKGIDNPEALFEITHSVTMQIGAEIFDNMPAQQQRQARIVLPTVDEARRMGILRRN